MVAAGSVLIGVLAVPVLLGLALFRAVQSEHDRRTVTDWESAERVARRDTPDSTTGDGHGATDARSSPTGESSPTWGTDSRDGDRSTKWDDR